MNLRQIRPARVTGLPHEPGPVRRDHVPGGGPPRKVPNIAEPSPAALAAYISKASWM